MEIYDRVLIFMFIVVSPFAVYIFVKLATYAYFKTKNQIEKENQDGEKREEICKGKCSDESEKETN